MLDDHSDDEPPAKRPTKLIFSSWRWAVTQDQERGMTNAGRGGRVRLVSLAFAAARGIPLTTAYIRKRFGVSRATAKRDMALIRERLIRLNPRQT